MLTKRLDPPGHSISPIATFAGDHDLTGDLAIDCCQPIAAFCGIGEERRDTRTDDVLPQCPGLDFLRHSGIKVCDDRSFGRLRIPYHDIQAFEFPEV
jgi:hypothetical protein